MLTSLCGGTSGLGPHVHDFGALSIITNAVQTTPRPRFGCPRRPGGPMPSRETPLECRGFTTPRGNRISSPLATQSIEECRDGIVFCPAGFGAVAASGRNSGSGIFGRNRSNKGYFSLRARMNRLPDAWAALTPGPGPLAHRHFLHVPPPRRSSATKNKRDP